MPVLPNIDKFRGGKEQSFNKLEWSDISCEVTNIRYSWGKIQSFAFLSEGKAFTFVSQQYMTYNTISENIKGVMMEDCCTKN